MALSRDGPSDIEEQWHAWFGLSYKCSLEILLLGVAKQLGPDGPGEGRQARAGALCALACVIFARHLRKEVLSALGGQGGETKGKTARLARMTSIDEGSRAHRCACKFVPQRS